MKLKLLLALALIPAVTSCHKKDSKSSESIGYNYSFNGCETGDQKFSSKQDLCNGLLDEQRNKGCAQEMRYEQYKSNCAEFGPLDERLGNKAGLDQNNEIVAETPCGDKTCRKNEFCIESKTQDGFNLTPPTCLARTQEKFSCSEAAAIAQKELFPTSNNCSYETLCQQSSGTFMLTCYAPRS